MSLDTPLVNLSRVTHFSGMRQRCGSAARSFSPRFRYQQKQRHPASVFSIGHRLEACATSRGLKLRATEGCDPAYPGLNVAALIMAQRWAMRAKGSVISKSGLEK